MAAQGEPPAGRDTSMDDRLRLSKAVIRARVVGAPVGTSYWGDGLPVTSSLCGLAPL